MKIEEIIKKSKEICEGQQGCIKCPLRITACVDKHGHLYGEEENELIEFVNCIEKLEDSNKKGKGKK